MADYPIDADGASIPAIPNPALVAELLQVLETVPRDELPDGPDRNALASAIRLGEVDNLYRPFGADYHNITWANACAEEDPRQRISDWLEARRTYQSFWAFDLEKGRFNA